jgi:hypothetical protein
MTPRKMRMAPRRRFTPPARRALSLSSLTCRRTLMTSKGKSKDVLVTPPRKPAIRGANDAPGLVLVSAFLLLASIVLSKKMSRLHSNMVGSRRSLFVKRVTHSLLPLTVECIADIPDSFYILVKNKYSVRAVIYTKSSARTTNLVHSLLNGIFGRKQHSEQARCL